MSRFKKTMLAGVALVATLAVLGGTAYGVATFRTGTYTSKQYIIDSTDAWVTSSAAWVAVPNTTVSVTLPASRLINARYTAESICTGGSWCSVRIVYITSAGTVIELGPQSGTDFAFDSPNDLWESQAVERTSRTYVPAGTYRVQVQAAVVGGSSFRLDDYHLNVGLISP